MVTDIRRRYTRKVPRRRGRAEPFSLTRSLESSALVGAHDRRRRAPGGTPRPAGRGRAGGRRLETTPRRPPHLPRPGAASRRLIRLAWPSRASPPLAPRATRTRAGAPLCLSALAEAAEPRAAPARPRRARGRARAAGPRAARRVASQYTLPVSHTDSTIHSQSES